MNRPGAIILAAGASSRMGSPKPLLELNGETFLDRLIGVFGAHCQPVVAVLGYHADVVERGLRRAADATMARNRNPERGQGSSLRIGMLALGHGVTDFLFCPVDAPEVAGSTIAALVERWRNRGEGEWIFRPRYKGRRGHPVLVSGPVLRDELLALPETGSAREVIRGHPAQTVFVDVSDAGILGDVDDPEQYRQLVDQSAETAE